MTTTSYEALITSMIDRVPVLAPTADLEDNFLRRLCDDLANGIFTFADIARRYGFTDVSSLHRFLVDHPNVVREVKRLKALRESDRGVQETAQIRSAHAYNDRVHHIGGMIGNPNVGAKEQLDAAKLLAAAGGITNTGGKDGRAGDSGSSFSLTLNIGNGTSIRLVPTVVEADEVPAPAIDNEPPEPEPEIPFVPLERVPEPEPPPEPAVRPPGWGRVAADRIMREGVAGLASGDPREGRAPQ